MQSKESEPLLPEKAPRLPHIDELGEHPVGPIRLVLKRFWTIRANAKPLSASAAILILILGGLGPLLGRLAILVSLVILSVLRGQMSHDVP